VTGQYRVHFSNVDKKLSRKYRVLNRKAIHGIFQAQQVLEQLQRSLTETTTLSVIIENERQEFAVEEVKIDPTQSAIQLLDILHGQFLTLQSDTVDGAKVYMEINRQFNDERKALPEMEPRQKRTYSKKSRGFSFFR
jgi:hypothetical protein